MLGIVILFLGAVAPWEIHALSSGLSGVLGFDAARTTISHPLILGPVFQNFSVLAPTWLAVALPAYAVAATTLTRLSGRGQHRRAPVWVTGSGAELAAVQYRPSAYSNPMRVILRGPLGYRSQLTRAEGDDGQPAFVLDTQVVSAIDRFLYAPLSGLALRLSGLVKGLQSGRLSVYLLYMLIALLLALSLLPVLR
jgi:hypothetical protein